MSLSVRDRVVIVTGGARGLGREMALALAQAGARVVITAAAESPVLRRTAAEGGPGMIALVADVRDPAACERVVSQTLSSFGALHVLVNNAGRGQQLISPTFHTQPTKFWQADPAAWREIIDVNITGAFHMARAVVPRLVAQGFGKLINISINDQTMVRAGFSPYGPSKAALEAASRVWAQDLAGTGVDVNVYLPGGAADTDMLPQPRGSGAVLPAAVMRRGIIWLCADASNGVTGRRYVARLWDETLPPDQAAAGAESPHVDAPAIM